MSYLSLVVSFTAFNAAKVSKINHIVVGMGLCQKSDFGLAYHRLGSYQVSI